MQETRTPEEIEKEQEELHKRLPHVANSVILSEQSIVKCGICGAEHHVAEACPG